MNSIRCNRDLRAHELIDLSTHPGMKRDIENANATALIDLSSYPEQERSIGERDDSTACNAFINALHGALSKCTAFTHTAYCLNLRRDDQ